MKSLMGLIRRRWLGLRPEETSFARRGFRGATAEMQARLERVGATFVAGYHAALEADSPEAVALDLSRFEPELRGFAFEGAAMGLALLDRLSPWRANRVRGFLRGAGDSHTYMIHVGIGWVWARMPFGFRRARRKLDPLLGWLAFDGWGFHEGFFRWPEFVPDQLPPARLQGYERRVFDQGLGRSFWFSNGGNAVLISQTVSSFATGRRADLWSGVGLAATYAGGGDESTLATLRENSGAHRPQLAQGAAFAAKARQRAGNLTAATDRAARILCGLSADEAARLTDAALENLPSDAAEPAFEIWRRRIQNHFAPTARFQTA